MGNASPKGKVRQEPLRETATSSGIPAATDSFVAKSLETHKDTPDGVPETPEPDVREEACIAEVRDGDCVEQGTGRNNRKTRGARSPAPATSSWVDGVLASSEELSPFEEDMVVVRMSDLLKSTQDQLQACLALEKQLLKMPEGPQRYRRVERFCVEAERTQTIAAGSLGAAAALAGKLRTGAGCTAARAEVVAEQAAAAESAEQARKRAEARKARVKAELEATRQSVQEKAQRKADAEAAVKAKLREEELARHEAMLALFWRLARAEVAAHMGQLLSEVELRSEVEDCINDVVSKVTERQLQLPVSEQEEDEEASQVPGNSSPIVTALVVSADPDNSEGLTKAHADQDVSATDTPTPAAMTGDMTAAADTRDEEVERRPETSEAIVHEAVVGDDLSEEMARLAEAEEEMVKMVAAYEANVSKREARDMAEEDVRTTAAVIYSSGYDFQLTHEPYKQRFGWIAY